jgi:hypothetical protein
VLLNLQSGTSSCCLIAEGDCMLQVCSMCSGKLSGARIHARGLPEWAHMVAHTSSGDPKACRDTLLADRCGL